MPNAGVFVELLNKYGNDAATPEERDELFIMVQSGEYRELLEQHVAATLQSGSLQGPELAETQKREMLQRIFQDASKPARVVQMERETPYRRNWIVAACLVLLVGSATYLWLQQQKHPEIARTPGNNPVQPDLAPGGNKAILTLSNGASILLDSAANGILTQQGNTRVLKTGNGQLAYNITDEKPAEVLYNTLATPRGGQYQLMLPDGSKVWLNAASSIHYPTAFMGRERKVEITGEAYFEVAPLTSEGGQGPLAPKGGHEKIPFIVAVNGMEVRVLGTHFNVNAYEDETTVRTTLLEGSVLVKKDAAIAYLKPGQQSRLSKGGAITVENDADVEEAIAWKNGLFHFSNSSLEDVMRQVARWYDVAIEYKGAIVPRQFGGEIPRSSNASDVLKILELSKVHFQIEGKKIIVMP
ncbi:MAG TPA: FecR domain-containing protein [Puia sp.]|nr:FecR domain-containing protein [Puia sp.]